MPRLARLIIPGVAHRRYTAFVGARGRWTGDLFQGRFGSVAMDEAHLMAALRYVALNPVKTRLVSKAEDWPWASTQALIEGQDTVYVTVAPALSRVGDFADFITQAPENDMQWANVLKAEGIGRPVGTREWIAELEQRHGLM